MITNSSATLYHYDEENSAWVRSYFPCAFVYRSNSSSVTPATFSPKNHAVIRIPNHAKATIALGDYIVIGKGGEEVPSSALCLKVTAFCVNNFGTSPHLKIICA